MRLLIWRQTMKINLFAVYEEKKVALEVLLRGQTHTSCIQKWRMVLMGMLHDRIGVCVGVWRLAQQDAKRCEEMATLQQQLEERATDLQKSGAVRELKLCLSHWLKGELGMRIAKWVNKMRTAIKSQAHIMRLELETRVREASVREIRWAFYRISKTETAARLAIWLLMARQAKEQLRAYQAARVTTKARQQQQLLAMRTMQSILYREQKGDIFMCIFTWRNSTERELSEAPLNEAVLESALKTMQAEKQAAVERSTQRTGLGSRLSSLLRSARIRNDYRGKNDPARTRG